MSRINKKTSKASGLPPGALIHIGDKKTEKIKITFFDYSLEKFEEKVVQKVEDCFSLKKTPTISWINIDGLHKIDVIEKIGNCFDIHPLVLEDILNTDQRPKMEDLEDYIFLVLKMLSYNKDKHQINSEQESLVLGRSFVISFQESIGDVFDNVRDRIRKGKGRIRKMGADYLAYSIIDAIVDNYFVILEKIGEKVEETEEELISNPNPKTLQQIYNLKGEMIYLRKSVWPLREVISGMQRSGSRLIKSTTDIYLRDLYDHTIQVIDNIETFRDMFSGMLEMYLSSVSNKLNEIMKILTIFSAIFIPLSFITGIYGMNFDTKSPFNMPELGWYFGYPIVLAIMFGVIVILLVFFKKKKWI